MQKDNLKNENPTDANNVLAVRLIANFMGWVDSPYPNLPNKVYSKDLSVGKPISQFKYHESWDEFMEVYSEISKCWVSIPDYKKKKFEGTSTYRAIQNRILLGYLIQAFELSVDFVNKWNAFKADR
jgi:hypothetical protein